MRVRGGLRRLAALVLGGVLIVFVVDTRPEWRGATGRVVPAPPGGRPLSSRWWGRRRGCP